MAPATELVPTLLISPQAPRRPSLESFQISVRSNEVDGTCDGWDEDTGSETPSPYARKASRVKKNVCRSITSNNQTITKMVQYNKSPKFAALWQNLIGSPPNRASEHKHGNGQYQAEDGDGQQAYDPFLRPTELPKLDNVSEDFNGKQSTPPHAFSPQQHTIREIFHDMKHIMTKPYNNDRGHAYILFDRVNQSPFFKIGKSTNPKQRKEEHERKCQLKGWSSRERPASAISTPMRLERLAQAELQNMKYDPKCSCGVEHIEYFWGETNIGLEALDFWCEWLLRREPYGRDGELKGLWADRLDLFQNHLHGYFRCGSAQCAEQEEEASACQACLRAGWKKWAEPAPEEELDYACRATVSSKWARQCIMKLGASGVINTFNLVAFTEVVGQIISIWKWISDPDVFLWAISLRLLGSWVEPRIYLPGLAFRFLLAVFDAILVVVCVYTRFYYGRGEYEYARPRPGRTRRMKRVSIGEVAQ